MPFFSPSPSPTSTRLFSLYFFHFRSQKHRPIISAKGQMQEKLPNPYPNPPHLLDLPFFPNFSLLSLILFGGKKSSILLPSLIRLSAPLRQPKRAKSPQLHYRSTLLTYSSIAIHLSYRIPSPITTIRPLLPSLIPSLLSDHHLNHRFIFSFKLLVLKEPSIVKKISPHKYLW